MQRSLVGVAQRGIVVSSGYVIVGDRVIVERKVVAALSDVQPRYAEAAFGRPASPYAC
jgi:hypothetical protein